MTTSTTAPTGSTGPPGSTGSAGASGRSGRPTWIRLAGWQVIGHWVGLAGTLVLALAVIAVVLTLVVRSGGTPGLSGLQFALQVLPWLPFGVAIYFANSWLTAQVAAGMTRRSFVRAGVLACLVVAATAAVALLVLLRVEAWLYRSQGWTPGVDPGRIPIDQAAVLPYFWGLFLLLAIAGLTGLIVGVSFLRWGPPATFCLPVTMLPLIAVFFLGLDRETMFTPIALSVGGGYYGAPQFGLGAVTASLLVGSVLIGLTVFALQRLTRRAPVIRSRR